MVQLCGMHGKKNNFLVEFTYFVKDFRNMSDFHGCSKRKVRVLSPRLTQPKCQKKCKNSNSNCPSRINIQHKIVFLLRYFLLYLFFQDTRANFQQNFHDFKIHFIRKPFHMLYSIFAVFPASLSFLFCFHSVKKTYFIATTVIGIFTFFPPFWSGEPRR